MEQESQTQFALAPSAARRSSLRDTWFLPGSLALGAGLGMVLLAMMVRVPEERSVRKDTVPELTVTRMDRLPLDGEVRERMRLLDPSRLFLPARVAADGANATEGAVESPGGRVSTSFPGTLVFRELGPAKEIFRPALPETPLAAMEVAGTSRWFDGMTRADAEVRDPASPRPAVVAGAGRMDVYVDGGAGRLATVDLPRDSVLETSIWRPIELRVLVDVAGIVVTPMITSGSDSGEVDERVRILVTRDLLPRLRLRPGAYRLVVGP